MKKIDYFWNRLYYSIYCYHRCTQFYIHKIVWSAIKLSFSIFYQHDTSKEMKLDKKEKYVINSLTDKRLSTIIMISDTSILALTMLLVWGVMNCLTNIIPFLSISSISFLSFVIISGIPSLAINHILIWRKERYLKYFNQFESDHSLF